MHVLLTHFSNYRDLAIHESSPSDRALSQKFKSECERYTASHFYPSLPSGDRHPKNGQQCENLESLTFEARSFDLFITQDVVEHILDPAKAFKEIARVLKPGGAHVFSVPMVRKENKSQVRASRDENGKIIYHFKEEYHGNPIDPEGSLVTMDWGYDITRFIISASGMHSTIVMQDFIHMGIRAEYNEIIISRNPV